MTTIRRVRAAVLAGLLVFTGACAQQPGAGDDGPGAADLQPDELVLRVQWTGGFVPAELIPSRLPLISVYADGRVISEGAQILIYPGPALPSVQVQKISSADVDKLVQRALAAGVGEKADFGEPPIADAPATKFSVRVGGSVKETEVYALAESVDDTPNLTEPQRAARKKMRDLLDALTDLPKTLGAKAVTEASMYEPTALGVVASPYVAGDDPTDAQPEMAWPGPALPGKELGSGLGLSCLDVSGKDTAAVLAAAATANTNTPWVSDGKKWRVVFRPILPDEAGCADLARQS